MKEKVYIVHTPGNFAVFYDTFDCIGCVVLLADLQGIRLDRSDVEQHLEKNNRFDFGSCYVEEG